jgi:hypothetical protein
MSIAPYQRSYRRLRPQQAAYAGGYLPNPAAHVTDQGAGPDPKDLAWCTRRKWRVIWYRARHNVGLPLWQGVDAFVEEMACVLVLLSSGFEPIAPLCSAKAVRRDERPSDGRKDRVYQLSCRVFRAPALDPRGGNAKYSPSQ